MIFAAIKFGFDLIAFIISFRVGRPTYIFHKTIFFFLHLLFNPLFDKNITFKNKLFGSFEKEFWQIFILILYSIFKNDMSRTIYVYTFSSSKWE